MVPTFYKCEKCFKTNCKLWRDYQGCENLFCADCCIRLQLKNGTSSVLPRLIAEGKLVVPDSGPIQGMSPDGKLDDCDQLGWYVPAVPVNNSDREFWGYTSVPQSSVEWWKNLPL